MEKEIKKGANDKLLGNQIGVYFTKTLTLFFSMFMLKTQKTNDLKRTHRKLTN